MYCDVLQVGMGCVYMQYDNVIAYALRQLCPHKRTYPTYDFKLTVVTIAYSRWHHNLFKTSGERIIVSNVAEVSLVSEKKKESNMQILCYYWKKYMVKFDKGGWAKEIFYVSDIYMT